MTDSQEIQVLREQLADALERIEELDHQLDDALDDASFLRGM